MIVLVVAAFDIPLGSVLSLGSRSWPLTQEVKTATLCACLAGTALCLITPLLSGATRETACS